MIKLVIRVAAGHNSAISDPDGHTGVAFELPAGATVSKYISGDDFYKIKPQLDSLAARSAITYTATGAVALVAVAGGAAPAAPAADSVHAAVRGDAASNAIASPVAPDVARNVTCTFGATWDGGDITVTGTNQFDEVQTEVIADTAGQLVKGHKVFKTITALAKEAVGTDAEETNTVTVGLGDELGLPVRIDGDQPVQLFVSGVAEASVVSATLLSVKPTSAPNGTRTYTALLTTLG